MTKSLVVINKPKEIQGPSIVEVVCFFNPEMYADLKIRGQQHLNSVSQFMEEINQRLSSGQSRRTKEKIYAEIDTFLRKRDLLQCFEINVSESGGQFIAELKFNEDEWNKRKGASGNQVANSPRSV